MAITLDRSWAYVDSTNITGTATAAGATLILIVDLAAGAGCTVSVADNSGSNTWPSAQIILNRSTSYKHIFILHNAASTSSITTTISGSPTRRWTTMLSVTAAGAISLGNTGTGQDVVGTTIGTTATPAAVGDAVIGTFVVSSTSRTFTFGGSPYTLASTCNATIHAELAYNLAVSSTAATGPAWTINSSTTHSAYTFVLHEGSSSNAGTLSASLPKLTSSVSGTSTNPGTLNASLPVLTGSIADQAVNTGTLTASLPVLTGTLSGQSVNPATLNASAPKVTGGLRGYAVGPTLPTGSVVATVESDEFTSGTGIDADDPALWVNTASPADSLWVGTNKASPGGGIGVFDLSGTLLSFLASGKMNNADLRETFGRILVVSSNRTTNGLGYFWLDPATQTVSAAGETSLGYEPYGCALYISPSTGKVYGFVTENAATNGAFQQYELTESAGTVTGSLVRNLTTGTLTEGLVADDQRGILFLSEEDVGFYAYDAEPGGGSSRTTIDTTSGNLVADVEGCAIAYGRNGDPGYVIVSSQGNSTFHVYDLDAPHAHRRSFSVDGSGGVDAVTDCDGLDITRADLGTAWPNGVMIVQDGANAGGTYTNFKLVDAGLVLGNYDTETNTGTLNAALPLATGSLTGTATNPGTLNAAVPLITGTLAGAATNPGTLTGTLPAMVGSVGDQAVVLGTLAGILPVVAGTIAGTSTNAGTLAASLPATTGAATGTSTNPATLAVTIPKSTGALTGTQANPGNLAATLPRASGSIADQSRIDGTLTASVPLVSGAVSGQSINPGTLAANLPLIAGSIAEQSTVAGTLSGTLPLIVAAITGTTTNAGSLNATLPALTSSVTGTSLNPGTLFAALLILTGSAADDSVNPATLAATLPLLLGTIDVDTPLPAVAAPERTLPVPAEARTLEVAWESRTLTVAHESRTLPCR